MPDDVVDGPLRRLFGFAASLVRDYLGDVICDAVGWVALCVVGLGRHAASSLADGIRDDRDDESRVALVGLLLILAAGFALWRTFP